MLSGAHGQKDMCCLQGTQKSLKPRASGSPLCRSKPQTHESHDRGKLQHNEGQFGLLTLDSLDRVEMSGGSYLIAHLQCHGSPNPLLTRSTNCNYSTSRPDCTIRNSERASEGGRLSTSHDKGEAYYVFNHVQPFATWVPAHCGRLLCTA